METIISTTVGVLLGRVVGLFLISNPVGWGTAIVLAVGSTATSYGLGKLAHIAYDKSGTEIDLVKGAGVDRICK